MTRPPRCTSTFETVDVIASCLLDEGHTETHYDYGNGLRWDDAGEPVALTTVRLGSVVGMLQL